MQQSMTLQVLARRKTQKFIAPGLVSSAPFGYNTEFKLYLFYHARVKLSSYKLKNIFVCDKSLQILRFVLLYSRKNQKE